MPLTVRQMMIKEAFQVMNSRHMEMRLLVLHFVVFCCVDRRCYTSGNAVRTLEAFVRTGSARAKLWPAKRDFLWC